MSNLRRFLAMTLAVVMVVSGLAMTASATAKFESIFDDVESSDDLLVDAINLLSQSKNSSITGLLWCNRASCRALKLCSGGNVANSRSKANNRSQNSKPRIAGEPGRL